ncbi:MAG TPA: alkaline phosphatase family protein [Bryobacteraceae bacterium]|nr:alkaline phosphatase family protein [Bryobacteraceae bacterium]
MNGQHTLRVFVLIDALGWQFLQGREFLSDVLTYRVPLRTVLGFSSGAIPTILTGTPPSQNGHWNLFYYDPQGSPFRWMRPFGFFSKHLLDNRVGRKLYKEMGRRIFGLGSSFECAVSPHLMPFFNYVEKRSIYGRGGISGAPSIFDRMAADGVPYRVYSYHTATDQQILDQAQRDIQAGAAKFFFLYLSEVDALLHQQPTGGREVDGKLRSYERQLRSLFSLARKQDPQVLFTILSDHGMAAVRHRWDLVKQVESLGLQMPADYLAIYDSTMARFWFHSSKAREQIGELLSGVPCGRVLPDDELRDLGIYFEDRRYGETILLLNPGWMLAESDFNGRGWNPAGMHGYHPDDPDSDAVFLSNQRPSVSMHTIADVYQCMKEAMA